MRYLYVEKQLQNSRGRAASCQLGTVIVKVKRMTLSQPDGLPIWWLTFDEMKYRAVMQIKPCFHIINQTSLFRLSKLVGRL